MANRMRLPLLAALAALFAIASGCGGGGGGGGVGGGGTGAGPTLGVVVPEFDLEDVNPASTSFSTLVSPSDSVGRASAWYFGHST